MNEIATVTLAVFALLGLSRLGRYLRENHPH